jgi:hypothetical protein
MVLMPKSGPFGKKVWRIWYPLVCVHHAHIINYLQGSQKSSQLFDIDFTSDEKNKKGAVVSLPRASGELFVMDRLQTCLISHLALIF